MAFQGSFKKTSLPPSTLLRVQAIQERHTRLQALRLTAVVDDLQERVPTAFPHPIFDQAWQGFRGLSSRPLRDALEEPAFEKWIGHLEDLLKSPALDTCPDQHVPRALARFSALVLCCSGPEQGMLAGQSIVSGSASIPILRGAAHLRPPSVRRTVVHWSWKDGLQICDDAGLVLIEPGEKGAPRRAQGSSWRVDRAHSLNGIRVFTQAPCVQHEGAPTPSDFLDRVASALGKLSPAIRRLVEGTTGVIGVRCERHPWEAASFLALSGTPSAEEVLRGWARNLVTRCSRVFRFDTSSRLADRMEVDGEDTLISTIAEELMLGEVSNPGSLLAKVLRVSEAQEPAPLRDLSRGQSEVILDFRPIVTAAQLHTEDLDLWTQPKCYQRNKAPQWRILDALLELSREDVTRLRAGLSEERDLEIRHFGLACLDYFDGKLSSCASSLLTCIELDPRCEEYWLLLAIVARGLGVVEIFEGVVFEEVRSNELLRRGRAML